MHAQIKLDKHSYHSESAHLCLIITRQVEAKDSSSSSTNLLIHGNFYDAVSFSAVQSYALPVNFTRMMLTT